MLGWSAGYRQISLLKDKMTTDLVLWVLMGFICDSRARQEPAPRVVQRTVLCQWADCLGVTYGPQKGGAARISLLNMVSAAGCL